MIPVATDDRHLHPYFKKDSMVLVDSAKKMIAWTNFYRSDDVSPTAYFYLDIPVNTMAALRNIEIRSPALRSKK